MRELTIGLIDDQSLFTNALSNLINQLAGCKVICELNTYEEFSSFFKTPNQIPDIFFVDINMPDMDGIDCTRFIKEKHPKCKVIILSFHSDLYYLNKAMENGASGFLHKTSSPEEILDAIEITANDGVYLSEKIYAESSNNSINKVDFTKRELDILKLITETKTSKEIASILHLSVRTIDNYRQILLQKTNSPNSIALIVYAFKHKLVPFPH